MYYMTEYSESSREERATEGKDSSQSSMTRLKMKRREEKDAGNKNKEYQSSASKIHEREILKMIIIDINTLLILAVVSRHSYCMTLKKINHDPE